MPFLTADVTTEHDGLAVYAAQQVHQVATTLQGLSREQLEQRPTVSRFTLGTLARHVLAVTTGFTDETRAATAAARGMSADGGAVGEADPSAPDSDAASNTTDALSGDDSGELRPGDTVDSLIAELESAATALADALRGAELDAPVPTPEAPWFSGEERWTVRWVALHCIEEVARHAGHADILRESVDGQFAYALNAIADGEPWPPANW